MRKFRFKSLTMRIWFILTAVILSVVLSLSFFYFVIFDRFYENKEKELLQNAHEYLLNSSDYKQINRFNNHEEIDHFIYDKRQAKVYFIHEHKKGTDESLLLWMGSFIKSEAGNDYNKVFKETYRNQTYLFKISYVDENMFLISYRTHSKEHVFKIVMIGVIVILIGLPIAKLIANSIAKPLKQLEAYTKRIANKEWNSELEVKSQDEIGRLAKAMNEMKHALKQADEEEKKFLQSISHDLKTPVMVIMSYAQAIIDGIYIDSAENTARIIKNEAVRLEKKIKQILYLNTLDYVLDHEQDEDDVYLDKLLTYLVHNFQQVNIDLLWRLNIETTSAVVKGNSENIRVSIENILENQVRFAATTIYVSLRENGDYWVIEIGNDGPLIPENDLKQIFKNLYKGDHGNFGLGLAISKKIIDYYHGNIKVENKHDQVYFTICYPKK